MNIALEKRITKKFEIDIIYCVMNTNQQCFKRDVKILKYAFFLTNKIYIPNQCYHRYVYDIHRVIVQQWTELSCSFIIYSANV